MPVTPITILYAIQSADPDGGQIEPTEAAYAAHAKWAIGTFGNAAWGDYVRGSWADPSDLHEGDTAFMSDEHGY